MTDKPVAIVTAASRGMGAACARLLAERGYRLALLARSVEVETLAGELGGFAVQGSLGDPAVLEQLVHRTMQRYGRIDAVINNTGSSAKGELLKLSDQDWHHGLDVLLLNVIRMARLVTPIMLEQKGPGAFVNISSFAAAEPGLRFPVSAVVRAGLGAFVKLFVQQYAAAGIRMNNILPGWIGTYPVSPESLAQIPAGRAGSAEEIARAAAFLVSSESEYITGQNLLVDGGLVKAL